MCGICGILTSNPRTPVDAERLIRMRDVIAHRGPDDADIWCHRNVGFGHRRLSVIDVAGGHQPLSNEDATVWVAFNGEIYNFESLMAELSRRGHRFRTRSDTEVLVHAYEEWGDAFVTRLNGMFAFSLYDIRRERLLLARDHFGIKPLMYAETRAGLFWGSEIKAVLAGSGLAPAASPEGVSEYLAFRYRAGDTTFFSGVNRLPAGHIGVWENGALRLTQYWRPPGLTRPTQPLSPADDLSDALSQATHSQLVSDVPLGAFCSGGLDSGLVTAFATRERDVPTHTFSVGFASSEWDESALARANAQRFGTEHHTITLQPGDFLSTIGDAIWHHDEPLSHPNTIPFVKLSRLAREHVTVVLTGEGADELFGGYPRYHIARLAHATRTWGIGTRRMLASALGRLPGRRVQRAGELTSLSYEESLIYNSAYSDPGVVETLTGVPVPLAARRQLLGESLVPNDAVASLTRYELRTHLACLLDRMDRATMAERLESRVPFLDVPLAEWALQLASSTKLRGRGNKVVVRQLAKQLLPPQVASARKSGFGLPIGDWLRREAKTLTERLRDPSHPAARHFSPPALAETLSQFDRGAPNSDLVWLLVNVYLWYETQGAS